MIYTGVHCIMPIQRNTGCNNSVFMLKKDWCHFLYIMVIVPFFWGGGGGGGWGWSNTVCNTVISPKTDSTWKKTSLYFMGFNVSALKHGYFTPEILCRWKYLLLRSGRLTSTPKLYMRRNYNRNTLGWSSRRVSRLKLAYHSIENTLKRFMGWPETWKLTNEW